MARLMLRKQLSCMMSFSGKSCSYIVNSVCLGWFHVCFRKHWEDMAGKVFSFRPKVGEVCDRTLRQARAAQSENKGGGKGAATSKGFGKSDKAKGAFSLFFDFPGFLL